jgi:hypothetical protein
VSVELIQQGKSQTLAIPEQLLCNQLLAALFDAKVLRDVSQARCGLILASVPTDSDNHSALDIDGDVASDRSDGDESDESKSDCSGSECSKGGSGSVRTQEELDDERFLALLHQKSSYQQSANRAAGVSTLLLNDLTEAFGSVYGRLDAQARASSPSNRLVLSVEQVYQAEKYVYFPVRGFRKEVADLRQRLLHEEWGSPHDESWILRNFIDQTIVVQFEEGNLFEYESDRFLVNINLVSQVMMPMFMRLRKLSNCESQPMYRFERFDQDIYHERALAGHTVDTVDTLIKRPQFFSSHQQLLFDACLPVTFNAEHICTVNATRFPDSLRGPESQQRWFSQQFERQRRAAKYNYRLAIPQRYESKIQFLLPLYLDNQLVLVATLERIEASSASHEGSSASYAVSTVLSVSMAYNNARLLGRIESSWLSGKDATDEWLKPK